MRYNANGGKKSLRKVLIAPFILTFRSRKGADVLSSDWGRFRSGQTGRTVNPLAYAFAGSSPALPTT